MPSFGPVVSAIYTRLSADSTLKSYLSGGAAAIYDSQAPENAGRPYLVMSLESDIAAHNLAGPSWDDYLVLVKAVTEGGSMALADQIHDRVTFLLEDYTLTIAGRTNMVLRREGDRRYPEVVDGTRYNHSGASWRCQVTS